MKGQIYQSLSGFYDVECDGQIYRTRARGNFRKKGIKPIVGDWVEFSDGYLLDVLKRQNEIVRPPLANVDQVVIVASAKQPDFSTDLLDRELVVMAQKKVHVVIYLSKTDLLDIEQRHYLRTIMDYYGKMYDVIVPEMAFDDRSLKQLTGLFANRLTVMMGQTGAGKSSLLNHLVPGLDLETGAISQALNRGKHTTRKVSLMHFADGLIADTPGFSSYDLSSITVYDLKNYFYDFVKYADQCKFRECLHINEPGCKIKALVDDGTIMHSRYQHYLQLFQMIKNQKPIYNKKK